MAAVLSAPDTAKAATMTPSGDMAFFSFPIEKVTDLGDGTVEIWGKATDGTLDSDLQVVDPDWSEKALKEWFDTGGNLRVQHQAQRDPAGKGIEVQGHHVRARVVEPVAVKLVKAGVLQDYSVGIMNPDVRKGDPRFRHLDPAGKAVNGVITGRQDGMSKIGEVSLVDRGSNFGTKFALVKAAADGSAQWVGELTAADEVVAKVAEPATAKSRNGVVNVDLPSDLRVKVSPKDLAKLTTFKQRLVTEQEAAKVAAAGVTKAGVAGERGPELVDFHGGEPVSPDALKAVMAAEAPVYKRDIDTATRRRLASEGHALPDGSYPIENDGDLQNAAHLARTGHGNVAAATRLIAREARERKVPNPMKDKPKGKKATKSAAPDVAKKKGKMRAICPNCGARQNPEHAHCPECGKPLPARALQVSKNHDFTCLGCGKTLDKGEKYCPGCGKENPGYLPEADRKIPANADAGKSAGGKDRVAKAKTGKKGKKGKDGGFGGKQAPPFGKDGGDEKDTKPEKAEKRRKGKGKGRSPAEGVTGHSTAPLPPHREPDGPAVEAFEGTAKMEDGDHEMKAALRHKTLGIDPAMGVLHDLTCPAFAPADVTKAFPHATFAAIDTVIWQQKALDVAASAPLDEAGAAMDLWQHSRTLQAADAQTLHDLRTEAHKAFRDANPGPGSFPTPGQVKPGAFQRPYISAGHAAASPQHDAPRSFAVPEGTPSAAGYHRDLITAGHAADSPQNDTPRHMPQPAPAEAGRPSRVYYQNTMRDNARQAMTAMHDHISRIFPDVCPMSPHMGDTQKPAPEVPVGVGFPASAGKTSKAKTRKAAKVKARKAAKAQAAKRRRLAAKVLKGKISLDAARQKYGLTALPLAKSGDAPDIPVPAPLAAPVAAAVDPETIAAAVKAATAPLLKAQARQDKAIRKQRKLLDAMAGEPDTSAAPFRGVALTKASAAPAGLPVNAAQSAELAQTARLQMLHHEWRSSPDPALREAAYKAMTDQLGLNSVEPLTPVRQMRT